MVLKFYVLTAQSFASFQNEMFPTEFFDRKIYKRVKAHAKLVLPPIFSRKLLNYTEHNTLQGLTHVKRQYQAGNSRLFVACGSSRMKPSQAKLRPSPGDKPEIILIVDDEPSIREALLTNHVYQMRNGS